MFLFEGVAYDLLAAAVGAVIGIGVAYVMVLIMASAFAGTSTFHVTYSVTPRTIVVAYAMGVLLTFVVVGASAWRVSRMNIVTAIRNLPEPPAERGTRRHWLIGGAGIVFGLLLIASGVSAENAITLGFGVSKRCAFLLDVAYCSSRTSFAPRSTSSWSHPRWRRELLARSALYPGLSGIITDIVSGGEGSELYRITLPDEYIGQSIDTVATLLRRDHKATLLSVNRGGHAFVNPGTDFILQAGDDAIVVAEGLGSLAPLKLHDINSRAVERLGGAERLTARRPATVRPRAP